MFQEHKVLRALSLLAIGLVTAVAGLPGTARGESELVFQEHKVPSDAALLARHAPVVVLHPAERSAPTNVEGFLADAELSAARGFSSQRLDHTVRVRADP